MLSDRGGVLLATRGVHGIWAEQGQLIHSSYFPGSAILGKLLQSGGVSEGWSHGGDLPDA